MRNLILTCAALLGTAALLTAEENAAEHARANAFAAKLKAKVETVNTDNGPAIVSLDFGSMPVQDRDLYIVAGLRSMRDLYLDGTKITNAGLAQLANLKKLHMLDLANTQIGDAGLVHLKSLASLDSLFLDRTQVSDAGLVHLKGLKNLKMLDLTGTKCTREGAKQLRQALPNLQISQ